MPAFRGKQTLSKSLTNDQLGKAVVLVRHPDRLLLTPASRSTDRFALRQRHEFQSDADPA